MTEQHLRAILAQYPIDDAVSIEPIPLSLINQNFFVSTQDGNYILQRLAKIFTTETVEDMAKVTAHLARKQIPTLTLIPTKKSLWWHEDDEGFLWKLMIAIPGDTFHVVPSPAHAFEAGRLLGVFQDGLRDFHHEELHSPLHLHETRKIFTDYDAVMDELLASEQSAERREAYAYIHTELPHCFLPEQLPRSVVHGDPKISNIIFQDHTGICMIDLDTTMLHTPLVDIGDAVRSWCGKEEDDPQNMFALEMFQEAIRGYLGVMPLSRQEKEYIFLAVRMITLELAARFATDVVNDAYFGYDTSRYLTRIAHNSARAYSMTQLARDMAKKQQEISRIIGVAQRVETDS